MAFLLLTRCFLLLLLVCDWAGDPYHGHSPLSRPQASQLYCCHSIRPAVAAVDRLIGPFLLAAALALPEVRFALADFSPGEASSCPTRFATGNLLYLFMSLQR